MFTLFLHSSINATDLGAVREKVVGWVNLSLSLCGCSSATVNGVVQGLHCCLLPLVRVSLFCEERAGTAHKGFDIVTSRAGLSGGFISPLH